MRIVANSASGRAASVWCWAAGLGPRALSTRTGCPPQLNVSSQRTAPTWQVNGKFSRPVDGSINQSVAYPNYNKNHWRFMLAILLGLYVSRLKTFQTIIMATRGCRRFEALLFKHILSSGTCVCFRRSLCIQRGRRILECFVIRQLKRALLAHGSA